MLHAELLNDPASLERGEELAALYIEGLHKLRADAPTKDGYHDFKRDISHEIQEAASREDMDAAAYEVLGRSVVELRRKHDAMEARQKRGEVETPEWYAAFKDALDFLNLHAGNAIAAEQTRENISDISSYRMWRGGYPKRIGGFIIPKVVDNTGLYLARRPHSVRPIARLQVFDRDWTVEDSIHYRSYLKIAIGE